MAKNEQNEEDLETDYLLLEHAIETATDFLTIDELIADYEKYAKEGETIP